MLAQDALPLTRRLGGPESCNSRIGWEGAFPFPKRAGVDMEIQVREDFEPPTSAGKHLGLDPAKGCRSSVASYFGYRVAGSHILMNRVLHSSQA